MDLTSIRAPEFSPGILRADGGIRTHKLSRSERATSPLGTSTKNLAGGTGIEPASVDLETTVLPLDEPPISGSGGTRTHTVISQRFLRTPRLPFRHAPKLVERVGD